MDKLPQLLIIAFAISTQAADAAPRDLLVPGKDFFLFPEPVEGLKIHKAPKINSKNSKSFIVGQEHEEPSESILKRLEYDMAMGFLKKYPLSGKNTVATRCDVTFTVKDGKISAIQAMSFELNDATQFDRASDFEIAARRYVCEFKSSLLPKIANNPTGPQIIRTVTLTGYGFDQTRVPNGNSEPKSPSVQRMLFYKNNIGGVMNQAP